MLRRIYPLLCCLLLVSCHKAHPPVVTPAGPPDYIGHRGPKVVLIPLFDTSYSTLPWSVSAEITRDLRDKIELDDDVFIYNDDLTFLRTVGLGHAGLDEVECEIEPHDSHGDFVILLELLQHDVLAENTNAILAQKLRIKVMDVRGNTPYEILNEIMCTNTRLPPGEFFNYETHPWGSRKYPESPFAVAHARLADVVADYIEDFVRELQFKSEL